MGHHLHRVFIAPGTPVLSPDHHAEGEDEDDTWYYQRIQHHMVSPDFPGLSSSLTAIVMPKRRQGQGVRKKEPSARLKRADFVKEPRVRNGEVERSAQRGVGVAECPKPFPGAFAQEQTRVPIGTLPCGHLPKRERRVYIGGMTNEERKLVTEHVVQVFHGQTIRQEPPLCDCGKMYGEKEIPEAPAVYFTDIEVFGKTFTLIEPVCPRCNRKISRALQHTELSPKDDEAKGRGVEGARLHLFSFLFSVSLALRTSFASFPEISQL